MKRYAPLLLTFLFLPLLFSCFDLEEDLYDQLEKEDYYTDYESLMASVLRPYEHAKWAETNFSFWLQELSADQLVITQKREHWEDGGVWRMIHQHTWDTYEKTVSKCGTLATEVSDIVIIHWRISKSYHMITSDSASPTSGSISPSLPLYGLISNFYFWMRSASPRSPSRQRKRLVQPPHKKISTL